MPSRTLRVTRLAGAIGAEVGGLDLREPLDAGQAAQLRALWLEHGVVFLRGQRLDSDQFLAFARTIGTPVEYPFVRGIEG